MTEQKKYYNIWDGYRGCWARSYHTAFDQYQNPNDPWALSFEQAVQWLIADWVGRCINTSMSIEGINITLPHHVSLIQLRVCLPSPQMIDRCERENHAARFL